MLKTNLKKDTLKQLHQIAAQRIMVIDGAMGTMIQEYELTEKDYRGDRAVSAML